MDFEMDLDEDPTIVEHLEGDYEQLNDGLIYLRDSIDAIQEAMGEGHSPPAQELTWARSTIAEMHSWLSELERHLDELTALRLLG